MGWLSRLVGKDPPRVPAGGKMFVSMDAWARRWCVRVQLPGQQPDNACKQIGPSFSLQTSAYAYLDWLQGRAATFAYPAGEA